MVSLLYFGRPDACKFIYHLVVLGLLGALSQFSDRDLFQSGSRDFADVIEMLFEIVGHYSLLLLSYDS